ncbi:hypothetical protein EAX61_01240 [Dokdonia sinensis]|uniref:Adhesin domain-containing protein n=1 Tax=Dokdonia sinensis TaxID=2479847 RepID=A0A3M0GQQ1_9FLAO|nr:hypothetical protein [Dokdonia sinensis]RMB64033.1 hypothetical protein EAX61_01240 [Dokdonia sinensis]
MKTKITSLFFLLLAIPTIILGNTEPKGKYTKEKKIKKEFTVNANARLLIDNSYGHVNIVSWNENRTVIEVHVKTNGNNEEKVQEKLDEIDVNFEGSASFVSAKTSFDKNRSRSWWNSWKDNNVNMEVNYTVKVPVTNDIDISNDYGPISLNRIEGVAKIRCDYGKMTLGELMADNNYLNFDYTNNSTIAYMKSGRINADYSSFTLDKGGNIELNADYSKSRFGTIKNLNYNSEYGSVSTDSSGDIIGRGDYLSAKFGVVHGTVNLNTDYGSINIDELASDAGDVTIQSDYTGIKIGYNASYKFTFNITLEYAGLSGKDNLEISKQRIESSDKYYEGYYGSASAKNNIDINSEYGGVTLTKI